MTPDTAQKIVVLLSLAVALAVAIAFGLLLRGGEWIPPHDLVYTNTTPLGINGRLFAMRSSTLGYANLELRQLASQPTYAYGWSWTNLELTVSASVVVVTPRGSNVVITFKP